MNAITDPSLLGRIENVDGTSINVHLDPATPTGLVFVGGDAYRIGQVGSFVRVSCGYANLYGVVARVGASAAPNMQSGLGDGSLNLPHGQPENSHRWMLIELFGEDGPGRQFRRGISQYPTIGDSVHLVTESDLERVYAPDDEQAYVKIGQIASAESIPAFVNINRLVLRHSAVLGSTGSGKSTTVASLLTSITDGGEYPSARVVLFDLQGEYGSAFGSVATVLRVGDQERTSGAEELCVPFWALNGRELEALTTGVLGEEQERYFNDEIVDLKRQAALRNGIDISKASVTVDTPLPFCIHKLWYEFHCKAFQTIHDKTLLPAFVTDEVDSRPRLGDAMKVTPPEYLRIVTEAGKDKIRDEASKSTLLRRGPVNALGGRLRDPRYRFLFRPGEWQVAPDGQCKGTLDDLIRQWVGSAKPITVMDISAVPTEVQQDVIGVVLRILFDGMYWGRLLPEGARSRPLLIVLEEAHGYLGRGDNNRASMAAKKIAREGRKYGLGLMVVSQRPSEVDPTVLSQCGTVIALRISNDLDQGQVKSSAGDTIRGMLSMLPTLRTGEALILGEAVGFPMRTLIQLPPKHRRPASSDPAIAVKREGEDHRAGRFGWTIAHGTEDYNLLVAGWRQQKALRRLPTERSPDSTGTQNHPEGSAAASAKSAGKQVVKPNLAKPKAAKSKGD